MIKKQHQKQRICIHEQEIRNEGGYQIFTGIGIEYIIVCESCFKKKIGDYELIEIDASKFYSLRKEYNDVWLDFKGKPEPILEEDKSIIGNAEEVGCNVIVAKNFATTDTNIKLLSL